MTFGYDEGEKAGMEIGEKNATIKFAKKLLEKKKSIEEIMELTELTREEIEKLK